MRKLKFLSAVAIMAGLVSCNSDDLNYTNGNYELADDGTQVFVTVGEQESGNSMRAGFVGMYTENGTNIQHMFLWSKGDVFKMYCKDTWKPQLYSFTSMATVNGVNGAVFTWADEGSKYNKEGDDLMADREYAVFPVGVDVNNKEEQAVNENVPELKFTDEWRTALTMDMPAEYTYVPSVVTESYKQNNADRNDAKGLTYVSNTLVPLFGFASENGSISFKYMTALLRVNVQSLDNETEHTLTLTSKANKLSGTFETSIEDFDAADYTTANVPKFNVQSTENDEEKSIAVKFKAIKNAEEKLEPDYFIYIPVPVGEYAAEDLKLDLDGNQVAITTLRVGSVDTKIDMAKEKVTVGAGNFLFASTAKPIDKDVNSLEELQTIFNSLADLKHEATYDIWAKADEKKHFSIEIADQQHKEEFYTLTVPELKVPVKVNLHGAFVKGTDGGKEYKLIVNGAEAGQKLTINVCDDPECNTDEEYSTANIVISEIPTIELNGTFEGEVEVTATDLTIGGKYEAGMDLTADVLTLNTLEADVVTGATIVNVAGTVTGAITAEAATTVTITENGTLKGSVTASKAEVTVNGIVNATGAQAITCETANLNGAYVNGIVTTSGNTIINGGYANKITAEETVTVNTMPSKYTQVVFITAKNVNIAARESAVTFTTVTVNGGSLTLAEGNTITTLNLNNANVTMTGGTISKMVVAEKTQTAVETSGAAIIKEVEGEYAIDATWDAVTTTAIQTATGDIITNGNIYTALQLAVLGKATDTEVNLKADVTIVDDKAEWTPLTKVVTFNGNENSISGLNIVANTNGKNSGFFGFVETDEFEVSNLSLDINSAAASQYVGGLVSNLKATEATIKGVTVNATELSGTATLSCVGGLIGQCNTGKVTIEDSKAIVEKMTGKALVGGLIGTLTGGTDVTVKVNEKAKSVSPVVAVTTFALPQDFSPAAANAGKFGMLVGGIYDTNSKFTALNVDFTNTINGDEADLLGFKFNKDNFSGDWKSFTGSEKNEIGYSSSATEGNVIINGTTFFINSTGNKTATKANTINWFGKPATAE